jgi:hypothetical protein
MRTVGIEPDKGSEDTIAHTQVTIIYDSDGD